MTAKCKHHRWSHECHECDAEWKPPMTQHQTPPSTEPLAVVLFWAAWELYPPNPDNPVAKMTPEEAFSKANSEQRRLARYQAARAMQHLGLVAAMPGGVDEEVLAAMINALGLARNQIASTDHDERCFTNDPNPDACCCVCGKDTALTMIDDALERAPRLTPSATGAEGWKLVPVEPTDEQVTKGWEVRESSATPRNIYKAMLAAAPIPSTTAQENNNG